MTTAIVEEEAQPAPRRLIWDELKEKLNPSERDEVAVIIGQAKLDRNQDVLSEIEALEGILEDYRLFNDTKLSKPRLPESQAKKLLEQEIQFLVNRVKSRTANRSDDVIASIRPKTPREADAYDRLVAPESLIPVRTPRPGSSHAGSRPSSGASSVVGGRIRPSSACSSSVSTFSGRSAGEGLLEVVEESLNVFDIETVLANVRSALDDEHDSLLQEVEFLRISLEDERDYEFKASAPPPSMDDMRKVKDHLEVQCRFIEGEEQVVARAQQASTGSPKGAGSVNIFSPSRKSSGGSRLRSLRGLPSGGGDAGSVSGSVPPLALGGDSKGAASGNMSQSASTPKKEKKEKRVTLGSHSDGQIPATPSPPTEPVTSPQRPQAYLKNLSVL